MNGSGKKYREGEEWISKTLCCAAALAANVYNYKAQQRVARERAVLQVVFRLGADIFVNKFF